MRKNVIMVLLEMNTCIYMMCDPKYYACVHIFFMLNTYLTLQWQFGRLHPRGVDVQVDDT